MTELFESDRNYLLGDPELEIIGDREKLAQWTCPEKVESTN